MPDMGTAAISKNALNKAILFKALEMRATIVLLAVINFDLLAQGMSLTDGIELNTFCVDIKTGLNG